MGSQIVRLNAAAVTGISMCQAFQPGGRVLRISSQSAQAGCPCLIFFSFAGFPKTPPGAWVTPSFLENYHVPSIPPIASRPSGLHSPWRFRHYFCMQGASLSRHDPAGPGSEGRHAAKSSQGAPAFGLAPDAAYLPAPVSGTTQFFPACLGTRFSFSCSGQQTAAMFAVYAQPSIAEPGK